MEINYDNAQKRFNEIKSYLDLTKSQVVKDYINECLNNTVFATQVYQLFTDELNTIAKEIFEIEKSNFSIYKTRLDKIKLNNEKLRQDKLFEKYAIEMDDFVEKNTNDIGAITYMSMMVIYKLTSETTEANADLLFNKLFKVDLTKLEEINVEKVTKLIKDKFIEGFVGAVLTFLDLLLQAPILTNIYTEGKFAYDVYKASQLDENLREGFKTTDTFMIYLEEYNIKINNWINHTISIVNLLRDIQQKFKDKLDENTDLVPA